MSNHTEERRERDSAKAKRGKKGENEFYEKEEGRKKG